MSKALWVIGGGARCACRRGLHFHRRGAVKDFRETDWWSDNVGLIILGLWVVGVLAFWLFFPGVFWELVSTAWNILNAFLHVLTDFWRSF